MNKKFANLEFLKAHLPEHLHPYCHLLTYVVTHRVSWLEAEQKEFALLFCMAALDKAWKKRQENPQAYTEAQFCSYVKKSVDGTILNQFKDAIETRQAQLDDYKQQQEISERILREEKEEIEAARLKREGKQPSITASKQEPSTSSADASFKDILRFGSKEEQEKQYEAILKSRPAAMEYLAEEESDLEDVGGKAHVILKRLHLLLPKRERDMAFYVNTAQLSEAWGISRARGQQIKKSGQERFEGYMARLRAGENFQDLLTESLKAQEIATKKEMAGKDAEAERDFQKFCREQSLDGLFVCARTFFNAYKRWCNGEPQAEAHYQEFCQEEEYKPDTKDANRDYLTHLREIHYFDEVRRIFF